MNKKFDLFSTKTFWAIILINLVIAAVIISVTDIGVAILYLLGASFTFGFTYDLGELEGQQKGEQAETKKWMGYVSLGTTPFDSHHKKFVDSHVAFPRWQVEKLEAKHRLIESGAVFVGEDGKKRKAVLAQEASHYIKPTGHVAEIDKVLSQVEIKKPSRHKQRRNNKRNKPE